MTEERRKEWADHIESAIEYDVRGLRGLGLLAALEAFEREVAEHAKREEREACALLALGSHPYAFRRALAAAIRSRQ